MNRQHNVDAKVQPKGEVVILVGMPGCGKTTYCRAALPGHARISQDEGPRSFDGVLRRLGEMLAAGAPLIVIDRTNPMRRQRARFTAVARRHGYRVRIVHFDVPEETCRQRIAARTGHPTLAAERMAEAIARYKSVLDVPAAEECDELAVLGTPGS